MSALIMEAVSTSEHQSISTKPHDATSQKKVIFIVTTTEN
jgi:hypothetical protein